ncbi:MAG TPA: hypothetical protein VGD10_11220 [Allosphingosinicella sp.]|uniref:hypothetical protein n=1 Tax=Allosphingosinicella sp. TaxID=2823234 RepID=UPI002EDA3BF7
MGDDVNPCSRTAPCKTFAGAISKTAAGGEINCLDPGGFGAVTITKSMTINCLYTEGGALAGGNGILVNAAATDVVYLRGLDIFGVSPPANGVRFIAGGALHIEESVIRRFNAANSFGISFQPSGSSKLYVRRTTIAENGSGATGGGILIQPTGASGSARVLIEEANILNNANFGISVNTTGNTGGSTQISITDTQVAGSGTGVSVDSPAGTTGITATVTATLIFNNTTGIAVNGGTTQVAVSNSTLQANLNEFSQTSGGVLQSFGDNRRVGNNVPGTFTPPTLSKS